MRILKYFFSHGILLLIGCNVYGEVQITDKAILQETAIDTSSNDVKAIIARINNNLSKNAARNGQGQVFLNKLKRDWFSDGQLKSQYLIELLKSLQFSPSSGDTTFRSIKTNVGDTFQNILRGYLQKLRTITRLSRIRLLDRFAEINSSGNVVPVANTSVPKSIVQILDIPSDLLQDSDVFKSVQDECKKAVKIIEKGLYDAATAEIVFELRKLFDLWGALNNKQDEDNLSGNEQKELLDMINNSLIEFSKNLEKTPSPNINVTLSTFLSSVSEGLKEENAKITTNLTIKDRSVEIKQQDDLLNVKNADSDVNKKNTDNNISVKADWKNLQETLSHHPALAAAKINGAVLETITKEQMISAINLVVSDSMLDSLPIPNSIESMLNQGYEYRPKTQLFTSSQNSALNEHLSKLITSKSAKLASLLKSTMGGKAHAVYEREGQEDEATAKALYPLRMQVRDILQNSLIPEAFGMPKILEWEGYFFLVRELQQLYDDMVDSANRFLKSSAKDILPFVVCDNIERNNVIVKNCAKSSDSIEKLRELYSKGTLAFSDYANALPENLSAENDAKEFCDLAQKAIDVMWGNKSCENWDEIARLAKAINKDGSTPNYNIKNHMKHYVNYWEEWKTLKEKASLLETDDGEQFVQAVENIANAQGLSISEIKDRYNGLLDKLSSFKENGSFIKNLLRDRELLTTETQNLEKGLSPIEKTIFQQMESANDISMRAFDERVQADATYKNMKELQETLLKIIEDCKMRNLDGSFKTAVYGNKYYMYFPNSRKTSNNTVLRNSNFKLQLMQNFGGTASNSGAQTIKRKTRKEDNIEIDEALKSKYEQLSASLPKNLLAYFENVIKSKEPWIKDYATSDGLSVEEFKTAIERIDVVVACCPTLPTLISTKQKISDTEKKLSLIFDNKIEVSALTSKLNDFKKLIEDTLDSFSNDNLLDVVYTNILPNLRLNPTEGNNLKLELVEYLNSSCNDSTSIDKTTDEYEKLNEEDQKKYDSFNIDEVRSEYAENIYQLLNKILELQKYQWKPVAYPDKRTKTRIVQLLEILKQAGTPDFKPSIEITDDDNFNLVDTVLSIPKIIQVCPYNSKPVFDLRSVTRQEQKDCLNTLNKMLADEKIDKAQITEKISSLNPMQIKSISAMISKRITDSVSSYNGRVSAVMSAISTNSVKTKTTFSNEDVDIINFIVNSTQINIELPEISEEISKKIADYEALGKVINNRKEVCLAVRKLKETVSDMKANKISIEAYSNINFAIDECIKMPSPANILNVSEVLTTELNLKSDLLGQAILKEYNDRFFISKILEAPESYLPKLRINTNRGETIKNALTQSIENLSQGISEMPINVGDIPLPPPPPPPPPAPPPPPPAG